MLPSLNNLRCWKGREDCQAVIRVTLPGALFTDCDEVYDNMRKEGISFDVVDEFMAVDHSPV